MGTLEITHGFFRAQLGMIRLAPHSAQFWPEEASDMRDIVRVIYKELYTSG